MNNLIVPTRRSLIIGTAAIVAAPAIVRAENIMRIFPTERYTELTVLVLYDLEKQMYHIKRPDGTTFPLTSETREADFIAAAICS